MKALDAELDPMSGPRATVGLIVLQSDEVIEHELRCWLPDDIRILHSRIPNSTHVSAETLGAMAHDLPASARLLPQGIGYAAIAYGCTSASTVIGEERVGELLQSVFPGVPTTNPLTALRARLENLGMSRIGLLAPYSQTVSKTLLDYLQASGIVISHAATFNESDDTRVARIGAQSVQAGLLDLGQHKNCEAVFGSCTNLRSQPFLDAVQRRLGKPVLTSNSVLAWHLEHLAMEPGSQ